MNELQDLISARQAAFLDDCLKLLDNRLKITVVFAPTNLVQLQVESLGLPALRKFDLGQSLADLRLRKSEVGEGLARRH
jgi:hypothetical protein